MSGSAGVKISDATPAAPLADTDMVPIARSGTDAPFNATIRDFANYVTILASSQAPLSSDPAGAGHPGVLEEYARSDHVHPVNPDLAMSNSPTFTGTPTAPTPPKDNNSQQLATTAFVVGQASIKPPLISSVADPGTSLRYAREDHVHPVPPVALLDSPTFVGDPRAPTAPQDDNTQTIANTAYVQNQGSTAPPTMNGAATPGVSRRWSREDHVHATDTSRYAASNPAGYVTAGGAAAVAPVQSVAGRTGTITITHNDITDWTPTMAPYAPLASPVFTGSPTAPTAPSADASTKLATTSFVRIGTATNDNAAAGQVGEFISSSVASGAAVNLTTGIVSNITSVQLSAGDWSVAGVVGFNPSGNPTMIASGVSVTSAALPDAATGGVHQITASITGQCSLPVSAFRMSISGPTTVYLVASSAFPGTNKAWGYIGARRAR